jgi:hypothetical protein
MKNTSTVLSVIFIICVAIALEVLGFAVVAGFVYVLSFCLDFTFTWKIVVGVWAVGNLARMFLKGGSK